jgi:hypothetical protein
MARASPQLTPVAVILPGPGLCPSIPYSSEPHRFADDARCAVADEAETDSIATITARAILRTSWLLTRGDANRVRRCSGTLTQSTP